MSLAVYRKKRNFASTSEPADGGKLGSGIFVVQLHHASHRHYDFRLELDGVLKSWAVPKGPSFDPAVKRLAVEVEDHPVSYAEFEGNIPPGNYGAGHVDVFDHGTWESIGNAREGIEKGDLKFTLHGEILHGSWVLVRTRMQGGKQQWLLIKHQDEFAGSGEADDFVDPKTDRPRKTRKHVGIRAKLSANEKAGSPDGAKRERLDHGFFEPELCKSVDRPPSGDSWLHEIKWDGYRILASIIRGRVQLWSRNGIEWTAKLPELVDALATLALRDARLDGEIIVVTEGRDDFNALQTRFKDESPVPVLYMVFDVVHANGQAFAEVPLIDRKAWLSDRLESYPHPLLRYSDHQVGNGTAAFKQAIAGGLEGVVSKRVDSVYSGTRSGAWVKAKARSSDEFIVVGFTEPKASRSGLGALLLAKPRADGLHYVGRVGTGIKSDLLIELRRKLDKSIVQKPSADPELMAAKDRKLAIWVRPKLVVEAFYQGIGGQGLLRQPAFKALRIDKKPSDVSTSIVGEPQTKQVARSSEGKNGGSDGAAATRRSKKQSIHAEKMMSMENVVISHPDRVVFATAKLTKQDVADYYRGVADWIL
ncbi:MAG: non-homologous end-joining DNA ligase, partial [Dokdonella sp.]